MTREAMMGVTFEEIPAERMQVRTIGWPPEKAGTRYKDLRHTPKGETAQSWTWEEMLVPIGRRRRSRHRIQLLHCAEGWYGAGSAEEPYDHEICSTICDAVGTLDAFREFHAGNPVTWRIMITANGRSTGYWYCDAELPSEYRINADEGGQA